ncbi:hypothetical protein ACFYO5_31350 [Streptomyces sp. NPDC006259]|uniref:hypothetical protein n=1 Tax=Streptomyces sp. NPDC006259 TaxID=3364740 RepID=UPI003698D12A
MEEPVGAAEPEGEPADEAAPAPRPRRRGRTTLLIAAAAVLGVVAGTCTGYLVQAGREPTKLPPLSQPVLAQAKGPGPEPLSAARDSGLRTDGDLRKLLLKKPKGAKDAAWTDGDGWQNLPGYANNFKSPDGAFANLVGEEFRRAAVTGWEMDSEYSVEIRLVQFRQEEKLAAADASIDGQYWAEEEGESDSWVIPGTGDGRAYVYKAVDDTRLRSASAHAWRGDIAMELWIYSSKPITKKFVMDLAERQMEQL